MNIGVSGLNHVTLAVTDLERALAFYGDLLGFTVRATWAEGAYLEAGALWLCLAADAKRDPSPPADYSHLAFSVCLAEFSPLRDRLAAHCTQWRANVIEGDSVYFLDPDGHKLEIHVGTLESRLDYYRRHPDKGVRVIDP